MSLRARLTAGLILVAAVGLLLLGGIVYAEQRSFLFQRVDDQVRSAPPALSHDLADRGIAPPGDGGFGPRPRGDGDRDRGGPIPTSLPPGTYGELRDAAGNSLGSVTLSYGVSEPAKPKLPRQLPLDRPQTVDSSSKSGPRYRVLAARVPGSTRTIVAAVPLSEVDSTLHRLLLVESIVIGGVLLALGALSWLLVRLGLRPLDRMGQTAGAIAAGDLHRRVSPATERTEVGRLGLALNEMLERLQGAFRQRERSEERLRQFIADASHELRTPLASIRGYAEAYRIGAAAGEEDRRKALARIEEEARRMGVLVDDLLTLARLDETRDAERHRVDLGALARDAVDDARAVDPSRPIGLEANGAAPVLGDEHQLRQVLANLLRNALVHTGPGTPVEVSLRDAGAAVELEVRDHGPGLPGDDPDALFERFWRSEPGRERGRAGAGLGLAIVAGIVQAHHGEVHAGNVPGGGAAFVVRLPAARA
jgi:two-component system, OmpR family, sensor kinase